MSSRAATRPIVIAAAIVVAVGAATGLVWLLEETFGFGNASPAYLLAVTGVAVVLGTWPAVETAVLAFLAYNFLFTHPRFTFIVADSTQLLNLVLLLVVGVVVGQLAGAQRHRAEEAERREREARVLFHISRALATRGETTTALNEIVEILQENTGLAAVWIAIRSPSGTERAVTPVPNPEPRPQARQFALQRQPGDEPARWMLVRPPTARDSATRPDYRVTIETAGVDLGSIWARTSLAVTEPPVHETRMLAAASDQIALALEQDRLRREATSAELARESEAMKSALLESVSHDLRTPLAAIRAAAGELLEGTADLPGERDRALTIDAEATRMDRLVGNLLDISRIEAGGLHVDAQPYALDDLVADSLRRFRSEIGGRLESVIAEDLPYVSVDAILLDQAVANVVDNSLRYAPGARLRITAAVDGEWVALRIEDDGPGVPDEALPHLFEKFYRVERSRDPARRGTGIGLAVVRGLVSAMHGEVETSRSSMGGLAVTMRLPIAGDVDLEDA